MAIHDIIMAAAGASSGTAVYVEDVFSTYLYTGTGASQTITNGIDLATKGGLVWIKGRNQAYSNVLYDTLRGRASSLSSNVTDAAISDTPTNAELTSFNTTGFTLGSETYAYSVNTLNDTFASWTFRKQAKFFDVQTKSHTNGTGSTVDLSGLGTVGMIIVKRTDNTSGWYVWHRSLTSSNNILLNTTAAQATTNAYLSVSGTTLTLSSSTPTGTYVIYAYAHDAGGFGAAGTDSVVACGSFTEPSSGTLSVNLGWEPQYILMKPADSAVRWFTMDTMRGWTTGYNWQQLNPNNSGAESSTTALIEPSAIGFNVQPFIGGKWIYLAIRRGPMKTPTDATKVFAPVTQVPSSTSLVSTSFPVDLTITTQRSHGIQPATFVFDRLRGSRSSSSPSTLVTNSTVGDAAYSDTSSGIGFDNQSGILDTYMSVFQTIGTSTIYWNFRRAPGFFDVVCYTGTGSATTVAHNLGVAPELMIVKRRDTTGAWPVYSSGLTSNAYYSVLNTTASQASGSTYWNSTTPTNSAFSIGTAADVNTSAGTYVAYLFASAAGVSKVGSYTGNGSSQTINCGFAAGARFVLIKRTDSTGSWWVFDSARGIVSAADPALQLNSTAAEVTSADAIDPDSSGFIVNQETTCNLNVSSATYIYLSVA